MYGSTKAHATVTVLMILLALLASAAGAAQDIPSRFTFGSAMRVAGIANAPESTAVGSGWGIDAHLRLGKRFGVFFAAADQDLGSVTFASSKLFLDGYGVGVFNGDQRNAYRTDYVAAGIRIVNRVGRGHDVWVDIGVGQYNLQTDVEIVEGYFEYYDGYEYSSTFVSGHAATELVQLTGALLGAGARYRLSPNFHVYGKAEIHALALSDESQYTTSQDGTLGMISVALGAAIGF
jgi:hypothetical protein